MQFPTRAEFLQNPEPWFWVETNPYHPLSQETDTALRIISGGLHAFTYTGTYEREDRNYLWRQPPLYIGLVLAGGLALGDWLEGLLAQPYSSEWAWGGIWALRALLWTVLGVGTVFLGWQSMPHRRDKAPDLNRKLLQAEMHYLAQRVFHHHHPTLKDNWKQLCGSYKILQSDVHFWRADPSENNEFWERWEALRALAESPTDPRGLQLHINAIHSLANRIKPWGNPFTAPVQ